MDGDARNDDGHRTLRFDFRVRLSDSFKMVARFIQVQWLTTISSLVERMLGVVVFSGDSMRCDEERSTCRVHSNRRRVSIGCSFGPYSVDIECCFYLRIVLKAGMRKAPIFGWVMESLG